MLREKLEQFASQQPDIPQEVPSQAYAVVEELLLANLAPDRDALGV